MYIIEFILDKFLKNKKEKEYYNPLNSADEESEDENCEHIFMPIDSTGETLACRNCGLVVSRKDLKKHQT